MLFEMSNASDTRQAGDVVSRWVMRTSFTRSPSASLRRFTAGPAPFSASLRDSSSRFFSSSEPMSDRSISPLATDCSGLPSNSVSAPTSHSSMRSCSSSTSTSFSRKISRCGLFLAAASVSAVM